MPCTPAHPPQRRRVRSAGPEGRAARPRGRPVPCGRPAEPAKAPRRAVAGTAAVRSRSGQSDRSTRGAQHTARRTSAARPADGARRPAKRRASAGPAPATASIRRTSALGRPREPQSRNTLRSSSVDRVHARRQLVRETMAPRRTSDGGLRKGVSPTKPPSRRSHVQPPLAAANARRNLWTARGGAGKLVVVVSGRDVDERIARRGAPAGHGGVPRPQCEVSGHESFRLRSLYVARSFLRCALENEKARLSFFLPVAATAVPDRRH
eukprot:TRINITY_DN27850_c0_g1_i1.p1 TRINITY_DN27850_c0_g1~~TRINITY_DN27850_c0_g1_i1.p1  ORF type:complete len:266 (+),score=21.82 TRINITY_DN27850_c0_g1_i1:57-854(+)